MIVTGSVENHKIGEEADRFAAPSGNSADKCKLLIKAGEVELEAAFAEAAAWRRPLSGNTAVILPPSLVHPQSEQNLTRTMLPRHGPAAKAFSFPNSEGAPLRLCNILSVKTTASSSAAGAL